MCREYTPISFTGKPTPRLSKFAHPTNVSCRVAHPYAHLRSGGFHSAERLNRPPPTRPHPPPRQPNPPPSAQNLSSPQAHRNSANPLKPNQIKLCETWHSYPHPFTTIEVGDRSQLNLTPSHPSRRRVSPAVSNAESASYRPSPITRGVLWYLTHP